MRRTERADELVVRGAHRRFEELIDVTLGSGILIDRRVMMRWDRFTARHGWPAVEAYERLMARAVEASVGPTSTSPEEAA